MRLISFNRFHINLVNHVQLTKIIPQELIDIALLFQLAFTKSDKVEVVEAVSGQEDQLDNGHPNDVDRGDNDLPNPDQLALESGDQDQGPGQAASLSFNVQQHNIQRLQLGLLNKNSSIYSILFSS